MLRILCVSPGSSLGLDSWLFLWTPIVSALLVTRFIWFSAVRMTSIQASVVIPYTSSRFVIPLSGFTFVPLFILCHNSIIPSYVSLSIIYGKVLDIVKALGSLGWMWHSPEDPNNLLLRTVTFLSFWSDGLKLMSPFLVISAFGFLQMVKKALPVENQKFK